MGSEARHRAPAGRRKAVRPRRRRPHRGSAALAAGATLVAVAVGSLSPALLGDHEDAPSAAAALDAPRPAAADLDGPATGTREREREVDERLLSGTLSRSAPRATSGTTNRVPDWLEGCRRTPQTSDSPNGQIPTDDLCALPDGFLLRGDAAAEWSRLAAAYERRFGTEPCMTDGYRDLASQQRLAAVKPGLAARPGTSNHGWGVAVDLCGGIERFGTTPHLWMSENAAAFGWVNPGWAREHGSRPEPWHWEYVGTP